MLRRSFILGGAACLATPARAVEARGGEWRVLAWSSARRGEPPLVIDIDHLPPIWQLRLQLAGQGALITRLAVTYADGRVAPFTRALFCPGPVVTRELTLWPPRRIRRLEIAVSAPRDRRAVLRVFGRVSEEAPLW